MHGALSPGVLPRLLGHFHIHGATSLLTFKHEDVRRALRLCKGRIVHAGSSLKRERLGEILVRRGLLSSADLRRASGFVLRDGKRLGKVLRELGLMEQQAVQEALADHVREVLHAVSDWRVRLVEDGLEHRPARGKEAGVYSRRCCSRCAGDVPPTSPSPSPEDPLGAQLRAQLGPRSPRARAAGCGAPRTGTARS